jgi:hypothetical protein
MAPNGEPRFITVACNRTDFSPSTNDNRRRSAGSEPERTPIPQPD